MIATALTLLSAHAAPAVPGPTADEWVKIEKGDVVTRLAPELDPPGAYAFVEIEATPDTVWEVLVDPAEAVKASGSVSTCDKYLDEQTPTGRRIGLHYVLEVAWTEVSYHVLRDFRPDESFMTWTLDPSKPNDLVHTSGIYTLQPGRTEGHQLLTYQSKVDSGRNIPQWVSNLLTGRALKGYVGHVRDAAEAR